MVTAASFITLRAVCMFRGSLPTSLAANWVREGGGHAGPAAAAQVRIPGQKILPDRVSTIICDRCLLLAAMRSRGKKVCTRVELEEGTFPRRSHLGVTFPCAHSMAFNCGQEDFGGNLQPSVRIHASGRPQGISNAYCHYSGTMTHWH